MVITPGRSGSDPLPGMAFSAPADGSPNQGAVADYRQAYASEFPLPLLTSCVTRLSPTAERFELRTADAAARLNVLDAIATD